jgi:hypothetical protein
MKFAKTTLILATLLFAMPALAKDKLDKELKKEKKRFTKEIRANKKAKIHDSTYKVRRSKFQNTSY